MAKAIKIAIATKHSEAETHVEFVSSRNAGVSNPNCPELQIKPYAPFLSITRKRNLKRVGAERCA